MSSAILTTDGAAFDNPGVGGWGFIARYDQTVIERSGAVPATTSNRMEMQAAIEGLLVLDAVHDVTLVSDSKYLITGLDLWRIKWAEHGWVRGKPGHIVPIPNADLWQQLNNLAGKHTIVCEWVRGHTGNPDNERANTLAEDEAEALAASLGTVRRWRPGLLSCS
jgi:ribonuclease HI